MAISEKLLGLLSSALPSPATMGFTRPFLGGPSALRGAFGAGAGAIVGQGAETGVLGGLSDLLGAPRHYLVEPLLRELSLPGTGAEFADLISGIPPYDPGAVPEGPDRPESAYASTSYRPSKEKWLGPLQAPDETVNSPGQPGPWPDENISSLGRDVKQQQLQSQRTPGMLARGAGILYDAITDPLTYIGGISGAGKWGKIGEAAAASGRGVAKGVGKLGQMVGVLERAPVKAASELAGAGEQIAKAVNPVSQKLLTMPGELSDLAEFQKLTGWGKELGEPASSLASAVGTAPPSSGFTKMDILKKLRQATPELEPGYQTAKADILSELQSKELPPAIDRIRNVLQKQFGRGEAEGTTALRGGKLAQSVLEPPAEQLTRQRMAPEAAELAKRMHLGFDLPDKPGGMFFPGQNALPKDIFKASRGTTYLNQITPEELKSLPPGDLLDLIRQVAQEEPGVLGKPAYEKFFR